jgi:cbb3-type cytochrome oxidase maturation protein
MLEYILKSRSLVDIIFFMVPAALIIAVVFVVAFIWATKKGQYDDLDTPAHKILIDDDKNK